MAMVWFSLTEMDSYYKHLLILTGFDVLIVDGLEN